MANPKRKREPSEVTRQRRIREVERLTLLGWTKPRIALELGYSERQVAYDRAYLCAEYKAERLSDQDEARDREYRRLLLLYEAALHDYDLSKWKKLECPLCGTAPTAPTAPTTPTTANMEASNESTATSEKPVPTKPCPKCEGNGFLIVERVGDYQFMSIARGVLHDIRELKGLNAPKRMEVKRLTIDLQQLFSEMEKDPGSDRVEQQLQVRLDQLPRYPISTVSESTNDNDNDNGNSRDGGSNGNDTLPNGFHELD